MLANLSGSMGRWEKGAKNFSRDVELVQQLLSGVAIRLNDPQLNPGTPDGKIARPPKHSNTVQAIEAFQTRFLSSPGGVIDVGGRTWRELVGAAGSAVKPASSPDASGGCFPFPELPAWSWCDGMRAFATNRSNGTRAHAGCDLYFPKGTWIYAVLDGTVVLDPYDFYCQTDALEVDHGDFIVRYGEILQGDCSLSQGDKVKAGQKIARVGHLHGITVPSDMLHFEMYGKTASGALTQKQSAFSKKRADGVPFQRRLDLLDPTPYLNVWKASLRQGVLTTWSENKLALHKGESVARIHWVEEPAATGNAAKVYAGRSGNLRH